MNAIVTSWSDFHPSIDEMPKRLTWKQQQRWIYKNLLRRRKMRFSCFEIGENALACKRISDMIRRGIIEVVGGDYPWTVYDLHVKRIRPRPLRPIRAKTPAYLEML